MTLAQVRARISDLCEAGDFLGAFLAAAGSRYDALDYPGLWEHLARRLHVGGEVNLASRARQMLREAGTLRGQLAIDEARHALDDGDAALALGVLDGAFGRATSVAEGHLLYAEALMGGDPVAALKHLRQVPTHTAALALAVVDGLRQANQLTEALALVQSLEQRFPGDARIAKRGAQIHERRNDWPLAVAAWRQIAETSDPNRAVALTKIVGHSRRLEKDDAATDAFVELTAVFAKAGTPFDLFRRIEALETFGQREAVESLIEQVAILSRRDEISQAQWQAVAQAMLESGRLGLLGWMIDQGLPVGPLAEAVYQSAPLTEAVRAAVRRGLHEARLLVSPDVLLPALAERCPGSDLPLQSGDRVLLVNATLAAGGAERQFLALVRSLLQGGLLASQVHVALFSVAEERGHAHFLPELLQTGVNVHAVPEQLGDVAAVPNAALVAALPLHLRGDVLRLAPLVRDLRPGVIHGWQDRSSLAVGLVGLLYGTPRLVLSARNMRPELRREGRLQLSRGLMRQICLSKNTTLTANSAVGARDYETWLDLPDGSVQTLDNGLDLSAFQLVDRPARKARQIEPVEILGVFRLAANKRPLLWLHTVAALRDVLPFAIRPRIVGSGPFHDQLLQERDRLGLDDLVLDRGLDDPMQIYGSAGMLLLMSRVEGTPNVVIEAQACGLAVAACDVGGVAVALLRDGPSAGLLLDPAVEAAAAAQTIAGWLPAALQADRRPRRDHVMAAYDMRTLTDRSLSIYGLPNSNRKDGPFAGA